MRIFGATMRKLARRLASWLTFGILAGLQVLIMVAVGATVNDSEGPERAASMLLLSFPGAYLQILGFVVGLGGLLALIYGAAIAGSEWGWGTLKNAVARGESRVVYTLATFAGVALAIGIGLFLAYAIGIGAGVVGANLAGASLDGLDDTDTLFSLPEQLGRAWLAIVSTGGLGFAIATIAGSQLAGIGAGIGLFFGEQFARLFLPDIVKYLPFDAATAVIDVPGRGGGGGGGGPVLDRLEPNLALLIAAGWLVGSLLVAALFTDRAEIRG